MGISIVALKLTTSRLLFQVSNCQEPCFCQSFDGWKLGELLLGRHIFFNDHLQAMLVGRRPMPGESREGEGRKKNGWKTSYGLFGSCPEGTFQSSNHVGRTDLTLIS